MKTFCHYYNYGIDTKASIITNDSRPQSNNSSADNFDYDINLIRPGNNTPNPNNTQHSPDTLLQNLILISTLNASQIMLRVYLS